MHARASATYRAVDLNSAPKHEIMFRLFDRFQHDLVVARTAIVGKDIVAKNAAVDHALRIVTELEASLDHAQSPELCANLERLYRFVTDQIYQASMKLDIKPLESASTIMSDLATSFRGAREQQVMGR